MLGAIYSIFIICLYDDYVSAIYTICTRRPIVTLYSSKSACSNLFFRLSQQGALEKDAMGCLQVQDVLGGLAQDGLAVIA